MVKFKSDRDKFTETWTFLSEVQVLDTSRDGTPMAIGCPRGPRNASLIVIWRDYLNKKNI
jgi:hypothetical protein